MTDWARLGRRNKNRGRAFEKRVAERFGWMWVGTLRMGLQPGDVVDGFWTQDGFWIAECKTQQPGPKENISVKEDWIDQMLGDAERTGRHPIMAVHLQGKRTDFVFIPNDSWNFLRTKAPIRGFLGEVVDVQWETKARGKGRGFVVQRSWMEEEKWGIACLNVLRGDEVDLWFIMRLDDFADLIHEHGVMVESHGQEDTTSHS